MRMGLGTPDIESALQQEYCVLLERLNSPAPHIVAEIKVILTNTSGSQDAP